MVQNLVCLLYTRGTDKAILANLKGTLYGNVVIPTPDSQICYLQAEGSNGGGADVYDSPGPSTSTAQHETVYSRKLVRYYRI